MKVADKVTQLIAPIVTELGYELCDVEYKREQGNMMLYVFIDSPNGIQIADCEKVSRAIDPILDENDPIPDSYYLSVSSLGLDRPLKTERDFERSLNSRVTVKLYAPIEKRKEFIGMLEAYNADSITIVVEGAGSMTIQRKDVAGIRPYVDFNEE